MMTAEDQDLERRIDRAALLLHTAKTRQARRTAMATLRRLVAQRTPEQVLRMEDAKCLDKGLTLYGDANTAR